MSFDNPKLRVDSDLLPLTHPPEGGVYNFHMDIILQQSNIISNVMPDVTWFFSTLSQATAAIVGLVIAFSASVFVVRREHRRDKIVQFQDHMEEFQSTYEDILQEIARAMVHNMEFDLNEIDLEEYRKLEPEETKDKITNWSENFGNQYRAQMWASAIWTQRVIRDINQSKTISTIQDLLYELMIANDLATNILGSNESVGNASELYEEITGTIPDSEDYYYDDEILPRAYKLQKFVNDEVTYPSVEGSMYGLVSVYGTMFSTIASLSRRRSLAENGGIDDMIIDIIDRSLALIFVGVFLPLAFLVMVPEFFDVIVLDTWAITTIELMVLISVSYNTFRLILDIRGFIETPII